MQQILHENCLLIRNMSQKTSRTKILREPPAEIHNNPSFPSTNKPTNTFVGELTLLERAEGGKEATNLTRELSVNAQYDPTNEQFQIAITKEQQKEAAKQSKGDPTVASMHYTRHKTAHQSTKTKQRPGSNTGQDKCYKGLEIQWTVKQSAPDCQNRRPCCFPYLSIEGSRGH